MRNILLILLLTPMLIFSQTVKFGIPYYQNTYMILPVILENNTHNITAISCRIKYDTTKVQFIGGVFDPYLLQNGQGAINANGGYLLSGWFSTNFMTDVLPTHVMDWVVKPLRSCNQYHWVDPSEVATTWGMPIMTEFRDTTICMQKVGIIPPPYGKFYEIGHYDLLGRIVR